ncbi:MAG: hypothetical protein Q9157_000691 [Trypethelium eluteriae]
MRLSIPFTCVAFAVLSTALPHLWSSTSTSTSPKLLARRNGSEPINYFNTSAVNKASANSPYQSSNGVNLVYSANGRMRMYGPLRLTTTVFSAFQVAGNEVLSEVSRNLLSHFQEELWLAPDDLDLDFVHTHGTFSAMTGEGMRQVDGSNFVSSGVSIDFSAWVGQAGNVWNNLVGFAKSYWEDAGFTVTMTQVPDAFGAWTANPANTKRNTVGKNSNKREVDVCKNPIDIRKYFTNDKIDPPDSYLYC